MNEREQRVVAAVDEILAEWDGYVGTHYQECWKRHVACFARVVKDVLEEEEES